MVTHQPRKQRKMIYELPKHRKQKMMSSHLSEKLYERYGMRNVVVRKGDIIRVMRGRFKGHEGKVVEVNLKKMKIAVEGVTIRRTDNKSVQFWLDASKVEIIKLDLSDPKRKEKIYSIAEGRRGRIEEEIEVGVEEGSGEERSNEEEEKVEDIQEEIEEGEVEVSENE